MKKRLLKFLLESKLLIYTFEPELKEVMFKSRRNYESFLIPYDNHPNEEANQLLATWFLKQIPGL